MPELLSTCPALQNATAVYRAETKWHTSAHERLACKSKKMQCRMTSNLMSYDTSTAQDPGKRSYGRSGTGPIIDQADVRFPYNARRKLSWKLESDEIITQLAAPGSSGKADQ